MKQVTKEEFDNFLKSYPRPLDWDVLMFCEPPVTQFNDFSLGRWPDSVVAVKEPIMDDNYNLTGEWEYRIKEDKL